MKCKVQVAAIALVLVAVGCGKTPEPRSQQWLAETVFGGTLPPESADQWIRFTDVGPINYPPLIVWVFPRDPGNYERGAEERVVILSPNKYAALATFVRTNRCPVFVDENTGLDTKLVSEFSKGRVEALCVLPCEKVHRYMQRMLAAAEIDLASPEAETIGLVDPSRCKPLEARPRPRND